MNDKEYKQEYYIKNRQRLLIKQKNYAVNHKQEIKEYKSRRILFKDKRIFVDSNPRTGYCSNCGYKGRTNLHHIKYDESNPLGHTIELCPRCHINEHRKNGDFD